MRIAIREIKMRQCNTIAKVKSHFLTAFLALLLISPFVITNSVLAACPDEQQYSCSFITLWEGEVVLMGESCASLCADDFQETLDSPDGGFTCYLYPIDPKHLLGTAYTAVGWGGCSVERRGRSLTVAFSCIQQDAGQVVTLDCTPCSDCCSSL